MKYYFWFFLPFFLMTKNLFADPVNQQEKLNTKVSAIATKIQNLGQCTSSACNIGITHFLDFGVYLLNCGQLNNWKVHFTLPQSKVIFILSANVNGSCKFETQDMSRPRPGIINSCDLPLAKMSVSDKESILAKLNDIDMGVTQSSQLQYIFPTITNCLMKPHTESYDYRPIDAK